MYGHDSISTISTTNGTLKRQSEGGSGTEIIYSFLQPARERRGQRIQEKHSLFCLALYPYFLLSRFWAGRVKLKHEALTRGALR